MIVSFSELEEQAEEHDCITNTQCLFHATRSLCIHGEELSIIPQILGYHYICHRKIFNKINRLSLNRSEFNQFFNPLTNTYIINMIRNFGNYSLMLHLCRKYQIFNEYYANSIGALEKYGLFNEKIRDLNDECADSEMAFISIEGQHLINKNSKYFHGLLALFIRNLVKQSLSLSKQLFRFKETCDCYSKVYGDCKMHIAFALQTKASVGYLMLFAANDIQTALNYIDCPLQEKVKILEKWMIACYGDYCEYRKAKQKRIIFSKLKQMAKDLLSWNLYDFQRIGKEYIISTFNETKKMMRKDRHFFEIETGHLLHMMGKISLLMDKNYCKAIKYFGASSCCALGLYEKVLSLKELSQSCYLNRQYLIGFKVLKYAYKLSNKYILPSFVTRGYWIWTQKFKRCIAMMTCGNGKCKDNLESIGILQACCGCMRVAYCSRKCQKIDWKIKHKYQCD
eukprot:70002_1